MSQALVTVRTGPGEKLLHPQRGEVGLEDSLHFLPVMRLHLPQADDLAHDLAVISIGLCLQIDVLDVVADALLLLFQALDALDEKA